MTWKDVHTFWYPDSRTIQTLMNIMLCVDAVTDPWDPDMRNSQSGAAGEITRYARLTHAVALESTGPSEHWDRDRGFRRAKRTVLSFSPYLDNSFLKPRISAQKKNCPRVFQGVVTRPHACVEGCRALGRTLDPLSQGAVQGSHF